MVNDIFFNIIFQAQVMITLQKESYQNEFTMMILCEEQFH